MERDRVVPVLERMTYGIYLLTTRAGEQRHAMVVSWVSQVSWDPLRVAVGIRKGRYAADLIARGENFALHLLDREPPPDLQRIKRACGEGSLEEYSATIGISGAPIVSECVGYLECTLHQAVDAGDHTLFIGDVVGGYLLRDSEALCTVDYGKTTYLGQR